jgi:hypothetical protein
LQIIVVIFFEYLRAARLKGNKEIFDFEIYTFFIRQFFSPGNHWIGRWIYQDSRASLALVYSADDKDLMMKRWRYPENRVRVVGNPNLDRLFEINKYKKLGQREFNYAVYIENGFADPKYKVPGWTEDFVISEISRLANILSNINLKLIVKLHPSSDYPKIVEIGKTLFNVEFIHQCDLHELIANSKFVIGKTSTVLMMALAIEKPVFLISIEPLTIIGSSHASDIFGLVVKSYDEFEAAIREWNENIFYYSCEGASLENTIGPFDGNATKRICEAVHELVLDQI